jgi:hypothetical protein
MALYPVRILLAYQIDSGDTKEFDLEETVLTTAKTIFDPVLVFYNRSLGMAHLRICHIVDMGSFGDDPLRQGSYTTDVVDDDVPAGDRLVYGFDDIPLNGDDQPTVNHSVYITNNYTLTQIYWVILFGQADIRVQLPASQQIIKE